MSEFRADWPTIYVATAEGDKQRGGVYHADALRDAAAAAGVNLVSLLKSRDLVAADQQHLATTPEEVRPRTGAVLVVTSAQEFPAACAAALRDRPLVASSLSALAPEKTQWADALDLRNRAAAVTVESDLGWPAFAEAVGLPQDHPRQVVGTPRIDALPRWQAPPENDLRVAVPTLVRGETPQAEYPLQAAIALRDAGFRPVICPHPREDLEPYREAGLQIADKKTIDFVAGSGAEPGCQYVVGPPGTVNADFAALSREEGGQTVGPAVVALTTENQTWPPAYLLSGSTTVRRGESVVEALRSTAPASVAQAEAIVGPVGGASERLVGAWAQAGRDAAGKSTDGRSLDSDFVRSFTRTGFGASDGSGGISTR